MNPNVLVAAITSASSMAVAVVALVLGYRAFSSLERRLEIIEADLKEFFKDQARQDTDIARLKDKTGLKD